MRSNKVTRAPARAANSAAAKPPIPPPTTATWVSFAILGLLAERRPRASKDLTREAGISLQLQPKMPMRCSYHRSEIMAATPSIKATAFQLVSDDLEALLESGRLDRSELEARLTAEDFSYVGKKLAATAWVPMRTYERALAVITDCEADGSHEDYLRERGRRNAARLRSTGLYRQLDSSAGTWGNGFGRIIATLGGVLYNFTRWSYEIGPDGHSFRMVVDDARDFPDCLRFVGEGFAEEVARHATGSKIRIASERVTPDQIVFRGEIP
jgi:hypothetical protein